MSEHTRRRFLSVAGTITVGAIAGCFGRASDGSPSGGPTSTGSEDGPTTTPVDDLVQWRVDFDRPPMAPAVADDAVYVTAADNDIDRSTTPTEESGTVAALDPSDGSDRWRTTVSPPPMGSPVAGDDAPLVVTGGSNGLTGEANRLRKFVGGEERWRTPPVDQFLSLLTVGPNRAYLGTHDDAISTEGQRLFGVDRATGDREWAVPAGDAWGGWLRDGTLFVDLGGMALSARDPADGTERWRRFGETMTGIRRGVAMADGALFLARSRPDPGALVAVDAADGRVRWRYDGVGGSSFVPIDATTHGDVVVATEYDGTVFALAASDGTERWTFSTEGDTRDAPVVVGDTVVVGDGAGIVYGIDAADGTERWRVDVPGDFPTPFPVGSNVVVVPGDREGGDPFRALTPDGDERWSYTPQDSLVSVAVTDAGPFLGTRDGTLLSIGP